jgi:subtilase family serine protease
VGQPYKVCFVIENLGEGRSPTFIVSGAGLGVERGPSVVLAGLLPGARREGCLRYPTTPAIGNYSLVITVDPLGTLRELREDNNTASVRVHVIAK